jgi:hypothetical protein
MKTINTHSSPPSRNVQTLKFDDLQKQNEELKLENQLLLETLHKVQEELETYYMANIEFISAIRRSENTMIRARSIVSRLAKND